MLGGMGSMLGSILSATVLTILPELLRSFSDYRMVVYSLALVVMMIFRPKGLLGSYDFSLSRSLEKFLNRLTGRTTKTQKEAAEAAVREIGLNQMGEVKPEWFVEKAVGEMFFKRLEVLKEAAK